MDKNQIKKVVVICVGMLALISWISIKFVFPKLELIKDNSILQNVNTPESDTENIKTTESDLQYYQELYSNAETSKTDERPNGALILMVDYEVTDVTVEKELIAEADYANIRDDIQISGRQIMNGYSCVCISLTVQNNRSKECLVCPNSSKIQILKDGNVTDFMEPFLMFPYENPPESAQHFHLTLHPGEKKDVQIFYFVKDEYLKVEYKMEYHINPNGLDENNMPSSSDDASRYFKHVDLTELIRKKEN